MFARSRRHATQNSCTTFSQLYSTHSNRRTVDIFWTVSYPRKNTEKYAFCIILRRPFWGHTESITSLIRMEGGHTYHLRTTSGRRVSSGEVGYQWYTHSHQYTAHILEDRKKHEKCCTLLLYHALILVAIKRSEMILNCTLNCFCGFY